jgi:hypothetical protein
MLRARRRGRDRQRHYPAAADRLRLARALRIELTNLSRSSADASVAAQLRCGGPLGRGRHDIGGAGHAAADL